MEQIKTLPKDRVRNWLDIGTFNKTELSDKIGISRVTLDKRLRLHNWTKGEAMIISSL